MNQGLLAYRRIADALAALFGPQLQIRVEETISGRVVHDTGRIAGLPTVSADVPRAASGPYLHGLADGPVEAAASLSVDVPVLDNSGRRCRLVFSRDIGKPQDPGGSSGGLIEGAATGTAGGGLSAHAIAKLTAYVDRRIDRPLSVADLARAAGLSEKHFARCFVLSTGIPPGRWLIRRRIETAQRMMSLGDLSLCEIALACGFADQSHFTTSFTRIVGCSPGRWRRDYAGPVPVVLKLTVPAARQPMVGRALGARTAADVARITGQPETAIPG